MIVFLRYSLRWIGLVVAAGVSVGVPAARRRTRRISPKSSR